jgi:hypothetical protein
MAPDTTNQGSLPSEETAAEDDDEITEEEEHINDELLEHPTRDDLHEQRERGQKCEGVIHARCHPARPLEPHGFEGTQPRPSSAPVLPAKLQEEGDFAEEAGPKKSEFGTEKKAKDLTAGEFDRVT